MRLRHLLCLCIAVAACESKPPPVEAEEFAPVPTMKAAPSVTAPAPPEVIEEDEAPAPPEKTSAARSGIGRGGGGGGAASGSGSVGQLLEASSSKAWSPELVSTDGDPDANKRILRQRYHSLGPCLTFFDASTTMVTATVSFDQGRVKDVSTLPAHDTAAQCLHTKLQPARFAGPPTTMSIRFRR